jgi:hypothetical protein
MTCGLPDGIEVHFPESGVRIEPLSLKFNRKRRNYAYAELELGKGVGERVAQNVENGEYAYLLFNGTRAHRLFMQENALEFDYNLDEDVRASLTLYDARKVLERGNVQQSFSRTSFDNVVDEVLSARSDPHGVITGYEFVNEETAEITLRTRGSQTAGDQIPNVGFRPVDNITEGAHDFADTQIRRTSDWIAGTFNLDNDSDQTFPGFDFDNITPMKALEQVVREFGVNWWVDLEGTVWFGMDGTRGNLITKQADGTQIKLSRYSITEASNLVSTVAVSGPLTTLNKIGDRSQSASNQIAKSGQYDNIRVIAEAEATDIDGGVLSVNPTSPVETMSELENMAGRILIQKIMEGANGSVEINGFASQAKSAIGLMDIGDHFIIDSVIEERCASEYITGRFLVTGVNHNIHPRRGWQSTVEVVRQPDPSALEFRAVFYDPLTDKNYESFQAIVDAREED